MKKSMETENNKQVFGIYIEIIDNQIHERIILVKINSFSFRWSAAGLADNSQSR